MRRGLKLWQRNVIGAAVTAAALVAVVVTDLEPQWSEYRATVRPGTEAGPGQSVTVDGQTWTVGGVRHLGRRVKPPGSTLPAGTVVTVVTLQRSGPPGPELGCFGVLTDGRHRWRGQSVSAFGVKPADGAGSLCTAPGPVEWAFVIPADIAPTAVDVTTTGGSIVLRLQL
ncbi:hypothetical protein CRI77_24005 [Mycolicibacterium duvalii]|uniref:Uncharacterized protein n=1 Tax=Mycolicibacterium duvalii TaxID=39688 RepID=A0A7I7JZ39_9MYCO|nr:hypothetical protein [Mycolicibacterium duvalii]MCV7366943.1 hypothetical protein [Mycolicibacterium duvalii]PEG35981.1 hypothetical protein CRI77_24005 [Mycolicibacterium duvalii]BBX16594.1 hypothetical protein MDUV_14540 [Mycolicibacterium duvalii]